MRTEEQYNALLSIVDELEKSVRKEREQEDARLAVTRVIFFVMGFSSAGFLMWLFLGQVSL